jgi:hypothetical protein
VDLGAEHGSRLGSKVNAADLDAYHKVAAVLEGIVRVQSNEVPGWMQKQVTSLGSPSQSTLCEP